MKTLIAAAALLAAFSTPAFAQQSAEATAAAEDVKINQLIVYGDDPCPKSTETQINVCARLNDKDRFRIPKNLRDNPNDPANQAWGARATELQYVGRSGIGSCSPVGVGGASGCYNELIRQARAERAGSTKIDWDPLIKEARKERASKIEEQARDDEEAASKPR